MGNRNQPLRILEQTVEQHFLLVVNWRIISSVNIQSLVYYRQNRLAKIYIKFFLHDIIIVAPPDLLLGQYRHNVKM